MKAVQSIFSGLLPQLAAAMPEVGEQSGHALPQDSLNCLRQLIVALDLKRVFEFGSGRTTKLFLDCGCEVTSLEDSEVWLARTKSQIPSEHLSRLTAMAQPLERVWSGPVPFKGWRLSAELRSALAGADLVMIDSPSLQPFREHALIQSLTLAVNALIVLDDTNTPTQLRFAKRLTARNPEWLLFSTAKDHGLSFFARTDAPPRPLDASRDWLETLKAWRRYLILAPIQAQTP